MKILYGVQATGNGHITRARAMAKALAASDIDVDFLFSGRNVGDFFDMQSFGDWQHRSGLTFYSEEGKIKPWKTLRKNNFRRFLRDIRQTQLTGYDAVITDFEPITAWAARAGAKSEIPCIGLGHQYAFSYPIPIGDNPWVGRKIMQHFAPCDLALGLHWHHFNQPLLPPIIESHTPEQPTEPERILVYLGFESLPEVIALLEPFKEYLFTLYGPFSHYESRGHLQCKPLSRQGFLRDLEQASGVICNAGFELTSEALSLGKKILVKPLTGQMEQSANAKALEVLQLGWQMPRLDRLKLAAWLKSPSQNPVHYPNVAEAIAHWLKGGCHTPLADLSQSLWRQVSWPASHAELSKPFTQNTSPLHNPATQSAIPKSADEHSEYTLS